MDPTGKHDLEKAPASPEALRKQLDAWQRRQLVKIWLCAGLTVVYFIGAGVASWIFFVNPSKAEEAAGAAITFAVACIFQGIVAFSSRRQGRAVQAAREAQEVSGDIRN